jgi:1,4-alpha-glucan branching enzyme
MGSGVERATIDAIVSGTHGDPFSVLGLHQEGGRWVARTFIEGAERVTACALDGKKLGELTRRHDAGFFEGDVAIASRQAIRYEAHNKGGSWSVTDAYAFGPVLGPMDDYLTAEGTHLRLFDRLGAHVMTHEGVNGVQFAVWAPNAQRVSVVGDFNGWDGRRHVMRKRMGSGLAEIFVPELPPGTLYKYEIIGPDGTLQPQKADPFAFAAEVRPRTASVVAWPNRPEWTDGAYMAARAKKDHRRSPISTYEVHLGSWKKNADGTFLGYDQLGDELIPYVQDMGFTHIELLPITEHPYDPSWGYQPTGLYAPTARFGSPDQFQRFVDRAHNAGIGIILDWVPAHFPTDPHGLNRFDGTALYEHEDPRKGFHPDWNTAIYNFGRKEVAAFLVNNAQFWLERYHLDGLRVDAVASMLYLDYSRKEGEWIPNQYGGRENTEAIDFLRRMNQVAYTGTPGVMTIAEESTAFPGVSQPPEVGGLGFGFKWNMGFMHDTLEYMKRDAVHRKHHHHELTFGLLYAFSENFVLPLSHDEVVHGKGSLLSKMAGDDWQKFANLRAYYAFMWGYPGKKLLFMGQEFAQRDEWRESTGLDWHLLDAPSHKGVQSLIRDLNKLYKEKPALHGRDNEGEGFQWLIADDAANSVFAWCRRAGNAPPIAVISNFTPVPRDGYRVPLPMAGHWKEIMNSDAASYGGSGRGNMGGVQASATPSHGEPASAVVSIPPLGTIFLEWAGA